MNPSKLQSSDYLDILFEGRNKKYGGYELRRNYPRRVKRSLLVLAGIALAVAAYGMVNNKEPVKLERVKPIVVETTIIEPPPIVPPKPELPPPPAEVVPPMTTMKFTPPVIEKDDKVQEAEKPPEQKDLKEAVAGIETKIGKADGLFAPDMVKTGGGGTGVVETGGEKKPEIEIYVDQMPEFNGNINQYLAINIVYPASAREANVDGRVVIKFVVSEDGSVTGAVVEKGVNGALDAEALRVVRGMPKWKPGRQNGKAVKVYFRVPVRVTLE
jgi:protein TonB